MTDQALEPVTAPTKFGLHVPAWWPHVRPFTNPPEGQTRQIPAEQAEAMRELFEAWDRNDGTRLVAVMTNVEEDRQGIGVMYVNHSAKAAELLKGLIGIDASTDDIAELRSIGQLKDTQVEVMDLDTVGRISRITAERYSTDPDADPRGGLLRIYLVPEPAAMRAVMVLFITLNDPQLREPFFEMSDSIIETFSWRE